MASGILPVRYNYNGPSYPQGSGGPGAALPGQAAGPSVMPRGGLPQQFNPAQRMPGYNVNPGALSPGAPTSRPPTAFPMQPSAPNPLGILQRAPVPPATSAGAPPRTQPPGTVNYNPAVGPVGAPANPATGQVLPGYAGAGGAGKLDLNSYIAQVLGTQQQAAGGGYGIAQPQPGSANGQFPAGQFGAGQVPPTTYPNYGSSPATPAAIPPGTPDQTGTATTAGAGGNPQLAAMLQAYMDQANTANEGRYGQLLDLSDQERADRLQGLNDQYSQIFGGIGTGVSTQLQREGRQTSNELGNVAQNDVSRGLTNTTIADTQRRGVMDDSALRQQQIQNNATNQETAAHADYASRLDSILGSLFQNRTGFIERRTDQGPDLNSILSLLTQAGSGYGGTGTAVGGTGTGVGGGAYGTGTGAGGSPLPYVSGGGSGNGASGQGTGSATYNPSDPFNRNLLNNLGGGTTGSNGLGTGVSAGVGGGYNPITNFPFPIGAPGAFVNTGSTQAILDYLKNNKSGGSGGGAGTSTGGTLSGGFANTRSPGTGDPSGTGGFSSMTAAQLSALMASMGLGPSGHTPSAGAGGEAAYVDPNTGGSPGDNYFGDGSGVYTGGPESDYVDPNTGGSPYDGVTGYPYSSDVADRHLVPPGSQINGGSNATNGQQDTPQWIDPGDGTAPGWFKIDPATSRYVRV